MGLPGPRRPTGLREIKWATWALDLYSVRCDMVSDGTIGLFALQINDMHGADWTDSKVLACLATSLAPPIQRARGRIDPAGVVDDCNILAAVRSALAQEDELERHLVQHCRILAARRRGQDCSIVGLCAEMGWWRGTHYRRLYRATALVADWLNLRARGRAEGWLSDLPARGTGGKNPESEVQIERPDEVLITPGRA